MGAKCIKIFDASNAMFRGIEYLTRWYAHSEAFSMGWASNRRQSRPPEISDDRHRDQAMKTPIRKGKVYLMGAGPGNPELLTVQAAEILKTAEVVLHDHLVPQEILDLIPAWTQVRNVGKRCGQAGISQDQLHALWIAGAREGKRVVRLKGGDPLLFGRVGEEMEALARAGVDFEVIPGVTSAMGAAAAAKIPL